MSYAHLIAQASYHEKHALQDLEEPDRWSDWGLWTECSRPCGLGISRSERTCLNKDRCRNGPAIRYKTCNTQPCQPQVDFRGEQCALFNRVQHKGRLYQWLPYLDPLEPCSFTCRAKNPSFVAKLASHFADGTQCKEGSFDVCVSGICMPVGCDLELDSNAKVDICGVCGGNGNSCRNNDFQWAERFSDCSTDCGKGYQVSEAVCVDNTREVQVDLKLCDSLTKPNPRYRPCEGSCRRWSPQRWQVCSLPCGGGSQFRHVHCTETLSNGSLVRLDDDRCADMARPNSEQSCNTHECPQWFESSWSQCSVSCGKGYQFRNLTCRDSDGKISFECSNSTRPEEQRECLRPACPSPESPPDSEDYRMEGDGPSVHLPWSKDFSEPKYFTKEWGPCIGACGQGKRHRIVECRILMDFSKVESVVPDSECPGKKPAEEESCPLLDCDDQWSETLSPSVMPIATNHIKLPKSLESAALALKSEIKSVTYSWRAFGFTSCSASCLGGTQESIIQCVRDSDQMIVSHYLCNIQEKPDSITQTCNEHPCPPRWEISDFSPCTRPCGGGVQVRRVNCIHEVTRGAENTIYVSDDQCPQPKPFEERVCNVHDCPNSHPFTTVPTLDGCTDKDCEYQSKTKTKCAKSSINSLNFDSECTDSSSGSSSSDNSNSSNSSNSSEADQKKKAKIAPSKCPRKICKPRFVKGHQRDDPTRSGRKVTLKIGGNAVIFKGDTLKIRCPRRKMSNGLLPKVEWYKNGLKISSDDKFHVTKRGALKIKNVTIRDSGIFMCTFGSTRLTLSVDVRKRPIPPVTEDFESPYKENPVSIDPLSAIKNKVDQTFDRPEENMLVKEDFDAEKWMRKQIIENRPFFIADQQSNDEESEGEGEKLSESYLRSKESKIDVEDRFLARSSASSTHYGDPLSKVASFLKGTSSRSTVTDLEEDLEFKKSLEHNLHKLNPKKPRQYEATKTNRGNRPWNITFEWMLSDWSSCSQICGGIGFQIRGRQCIILFANQSRPVKDEFCLKEGLFMPDIIRNCGLQECPKWKVGEWSECKKCLKYGEGEETRQVDCVLPNGTKVDNSFCMQEDRPSMDRPCSNDDCRPMWNVTDWSSCLGDCNEEGTQQRVVMCVWFTDIKSTAFGCDPSKKPRSSRKCTVNCEVNQL